MPRRLEVTTPAEVVPSSQDQTAVCVPGSVKVPWTFADVAMATGAAGTVTPWTDGLETVASTNGLSELTRA